MVGQKKSAEFISDSENDSQNEADDIDRLATPSVSPQSMVSNDQRLLAMTSNPTSSPKRKRSDTKEKSAVSKPGIPSLFCGVSDAYNLFSASIDITFDVTVFSIAEMKKPAKQRGDGSSSYIVFTSSEPWDTLKAQLMAKISQILDPTPITFEDYHVTFTVPRHSKTPLPLLSSDDFTQLLQRTLKTKTNPTAKIVVEAKVPGKVSGNKVSCVCQ
jgi:hypothetical protein